MDLIQQRLKRIEEKKKFIKSKKDRRLQNYSSNFNEMFNFFLSGYRKGLLDFCGSIVNAAYDSDSEDGKFSFRQFDNGKFKNLDIYYTQHPNILKAVITGKKSWGLYKTEYALGIAECNFTKEELLKEFEDRNLVIPKVLMVEFDNEIERLKQLRYAQYVFKS